MIIAGYRNECRFIKSDFYEDVFYKSYDEAIELCNIDTNNLVKVTKEERTEFMRVFGEIVTKKNYVNKKRDHFGKLPIWSFF